MRRIWILLTALAVLLCGCTLFEQTTTQPEETSVSEEPQSSSDPSTEQTETLYTLGWSPALGLNPFLTQSTTNRTWMPLIYESLFQLTPEFQAEPLLCKEATVSADELSWVFTLRQDARFSNGVPLTAADVVYSLELARDSERYSTRMEYIHSVTQSGQYEVTVVLSKPLGSLPKLLDIPIIRSGSVENPLGTGPYVLVQKKEEAYLERVSDWREDTPIDRIYLYEVSNVDSVRDAFEFGYVDLVVTDLNAVGAVNIHSNYELWSEDTTIMQFLSFQEESSIFRNTSVRAAVTHAIDRQKLITELYDGYGVSATLPAHPLSDCYDLPLSQNYGYDSEILENAVIDAGMSGRRGTLLVNGENASTVSAAEAIAASLRQAGLEIEVAAASGENYRALLAKGGYDLVLCEVRLTADFDLSAFFGGALSDYAIQDEEVPALCSAALENSGNFYDLHKHIMDDGLLCPLLFKTRAVMSDRGTVIGLHPAPGNVFYDLGGLTILPN